MEISTSILSVKTDLKEAIDKLNKVDTDYLHIDIMDGNFVSNTTWHASSLVDSLKDNTKPLDVHLMVSDVISYVEEFSRLNPSFITFHLEATDDINKVINYIKARDIKVGLAIKPNTKIEELYPFLPYIDLVLVMSVEPGYGGQPFIMSTIDKVNKLYDYRKEVGLDYLIEVDGGITDKTIKLVYNVDIAVSGSFITNNDYQESINKLKS